MVPKAINLTEQQPRCAGCWSTICLRVGILVSILTVALIGAPLGVEAQPSAKMWRIGYLTPARDTPGTTLRETLREALGGLGYVEGRNLRYEVRAAENNVDRLPHLAAELV